MNAASLANILLKYPDAEVYIEDPEGYDCEIGDVQESSRMVKGGEEVKICLVAEPK